MEVDVHPSGERDRVAGGHEQPVQLVLDDLCDAAEVEWSLVTSQSVLRVLRLRGDQSTYPTADSVSEALHHFSDVMSERRRLLPLLGKSA